MNEFEEITKNQFFIIDSKNLKDVESRLYGFTVHDSKIIQDKDFNEDIKLNGVGTYILVKCDSDSITISQDFNGSYGIYVFEKNDRFVISNSFLKLMEYIKEEEIITLNHDYAKALIAADLCSFSYSETLIKEIVMIPKNYIVRIDLNSKSFYYEQVNYGENTIEIKSKQAMEILDSWFFRWTELFRNLKKETNNIQSDLSGGFDSRLIFALLSSSNIDLNKIRIHSIPDTKHTHKEDFEIATAISKEYGFLLNNNVISLHKNNFVDVATSINVSFYTKLGFHKQMMFKIFKSIEPIYLISGGGGECLRDYWNISPEEFTSQCIRRSKNYSAELVNGTKNILKRDFDELNDVSSNHDRKLSLTEILYRESRSRNHFGKAAVESYLVNAIKLYPLLDPELHKIILNDDECNDKNLLISLIFARYCPKLLDFPFEGNRTIDKKTIEYAFKINEKYPLENFVYEFISSPSDEITYDLDDFNPNDSGEIVKDNESNRYIEELFFSRNFQRLFETYFSHHLYQELVRNIRGSNYFPLEDAYVSIAVLKAINDVNYSKNKKANSIFDWLELIKKQEETISNPLIKVLPSLKKYNTARIDLKNNGNHLNNLKIYQNSDFNQISAPLWFKDEKGIGWVIESCVNEIDIGVECVGDGQLSIQLRGIDSRDSEGNRIPVYINYTCLSVNEIPIFNESKLIFHDKPYEHKMNVQNGEKLKIHVEWLPFISS